MSDDALLQRRREINRKAATKSRRKQKELSTKIKKKYYAEQSVNTQLMYELRQLKKQRDELRQQYDEHKQFCSHSDILVDVPDQIITEVSSLSSSSSSSSSSRKPSLKETSLGDGTSQGHRVKQVSCRTTKRSLSFPTEYLSSSKEPEFEDVDEEKSSASLSEHPESIGGDWSSGELEDDVLDVGLLPGLDASDKHENTLNVDRRPNVVSSTSASAHNQPVIVVDLTFAFPPTSFDAFSTTRSLTTTSYDASDYSMELVNHSDLFRPSFDEIPYNTTQLEFESSSDMQPSISAMSSSPFPTYDKSSTPFCSTITPPSYTRDIEYDSSFSLFPLRSRDVSEFFQNPSSPSQIYNPDDDWSFSLRSRDASASFHEPSRSETYETDYDSSVSLRSRDASAFFLRPDPITSTEANLRTTTNQRFENISRRETELRSEDTDRISTGVEDYSTITDRVAAANLLDEQTYCEEDSRFTGMRDFLDDSKYDVSLESFSQLRNDAEQRQSVLRQLTVGLESERSSNSYREAGYSEAANNLPYSNTNVSGDISGEHGSTWSNRPKYFGIDFDKDEDRRVIAALSQTASASAESQLSDVEGRHRDVQRFKNTVPPLNRSVSNEMTSSFSQLLYNIGPDKKFTIAAGQNVSLATSSRVNQRSSRPVVYRSATETVQDQAGARGVTLILPPGAARASGMQVTERTEREADVMVSKKSRHRTSGSFADGVQKSFKHDHSHLKEVLATESGMRKEGNDESTDRDFESHAGNIPTHVKHFSSGM